MSTLSPVSPDPAANAGPASAPDGGPGAPPRRNGPFSRANVVQTIAGGYIPLILATLVVFLPLLWMLLSSFKQPGEIVTTDLKILPGSLNLENYHVAMTTVPFARFFLNSLIVTTVGATVKVILAILTAYALVFVRFPFKNVIFVVILVALMVPPQVSILPNYILIAGMGGKNTLWGIILPGLGTAFGTFLLRQHFMTLPGSILEAAEIDGAGHWRRLWQVVAPVSVPSIATVALVTVVSEWNDYIWPLIITDRPETMTLPVGLTLLQNSEGNGSGWGKYKGGVGTASVTLENGVVVGALAVVNALGLPAGGSGTLKLPEGHMPPSLNTTLVVVATNAVLDKAECRRTASAAHAGLARALNPSHTLADGDTVFCLATGAVALDRSTEAARQLSLITLQSAAADVVRLAILDGIACAEAVSTQAGEFGAYGG